MESFGAGYVALPNKHDGGNPKFGFGDSESIFKMLILPMYKGIDLRIIDKCSREYTKR